MQARVCDVTGCFVFVSGRAILCQGRGTGYRVDIGSCGVGMYGCVKGALSCLIGCVTFVYCSCGGLNVG